MTAMLLPETSASLPRRRTSLAARPRGRPNPRTLAGGEPPEPADDGLAVDDGLPPHAAVSKPAAVTVMTAATRAR